MKRRAPRWLAGLPAPSRQGAQALLEFSLTIPLFLFVLLAIIDLGRLTAMATGMASGAREAVRVASLPGASGSGVRSDSEIKQAVHNLVPQLSSPAFDQSIHIKIACRDTANNPASCASRTSGWTVQVAVAYPFTPLPPFSAPLGAFSSFGVSPYSTEQCTTSYSYASQSFALGGEAGCLVLTAAATGRVE